MIDKCFDLKVTLQRCAVCFLVSNSVSFAADSPQSVLIRFEGIVDATQKQITTVERMQALGTQLNVALMARPGPAPDLMLATAEGMSAEDLADRLQSLPGVKFASPDRRKFPGVQPNDPLFQTQWALQQTEAAAIGATLAWNVTTGSNAVVLDIDVRLA